jgi:hypothetical protein
MQMIEAARQAESAANIVAVERLPEERVHMYGVLGIDERTGKLFSLTQMVEKPARAGALKPDHHRPLHPAAENLGLPRRREARRKRRDPSSPTP